MSDYIKRDDALNMDFKIEIIRFEPKIRTAKRAVQAYVNRLAALPAADVVEVARCKDCVHAKVNVNVPQKPLICYLTRRVGEVEENWFCADGERRSE